MKPNIKRFNATNSVRGISTTHTSPSISMRKSGQFRGNKYLLKLLGAKVGDGVEFIYDETTDEWYVGRVKDNGIPLRKSSNGGGIIHSVVVRDAITKSTELHSGRFLVASEPTVVGGDKYFSILIGSAKKAAA